MNTNSNGYTIVYTSIIVILVAAILAAVSMALKPLQDANIKADTISQMLTAAQYATKDELESKSNDEILSIYKENITDAFLIRLDGSKDRDLDAKGNGEVFSTNQLKAQNSALKIGKTDGVTLPVYNFDFNGKKVTVVAIYGAGLWGPVWGYIALEPDHSSIVGAYFDHASETPGLGAKIKDDPSFRAQFAGKKIDFSAEPVFAIVKGGVPDGQQNAVDAITGATMTSKGLSAAIASWMDLYKPYLTKVEE